MGHRTRGRFARRALVAGRIFRLRRAVVPHESAPSSAVGRSVCGFCCRAQRATSRTGLGAPALCGDQHLLLVRSGENRFQLRRNGRAAIPGHAHWIRGSVHRILAGRVQVRGGTCLPNFGTAHRGRTLHATDRQNLAAAGVAGSDAVDPRLADLGAQPARHESSARRHRVEHLVPVTSLVTR